MNRFYLIILLLVISSSAKTQTIPQPVDSNVLIVVNGKIAGTFRDLKKDINALYQPDLIERIDILKGPDAIAKYGDKWKAGVIEITLKNVTVTANYADSIYRKVEVEASFPGSDMAWRRYLERNLNAQIPGNKGAPAGTYTVMVQFVVDRNGLISEIMPLTKHGYGMEEEVVRVISKGPNWIPAIQGGIPVKAYRKQPITFQIADEDWYRLSTLRIPAGKPTSIEIKELDHLKDDEIVVTVTNGTIKHESGKKYLITVEKPGKTFLNVSKKAKKRKDEVDYGTKEITVE